MIDPLRNLQIETTTACNAACRFCPHPDMERKGRMPFHLFQNIVRQGLDLGCNHVYPFLLNEPLADVRLAEWTAWLATQGAQFSIFTNAELLGQTNRDWLLSSTNLHALWISFYGTTKEVYERAMQGLSFETSSANVDAVIATYEARRAAGLHTAQHLFVRMSEYEDTAGQTAAFKAKFGQYAAVTGHVNWAGLRPSAYADLTSQQWPCQRILDQMYVMVDGRVCLCCLDGLGKVILGDLRTLPDVFHRLRAQGFRDAHKRYDFDFHLCRTCSLNRGTDPWAGKYQRP